MSYISALEGARWVGCDYAGVPVIRRRFVLDCVSADASLVITGLGYFEASINGMPVSADKFQPNITDYERRSFEKITYPCRDTFTHRIYVCRYPVSELLTAGENILEIRLGGGFYRQTERVAEGHMSYGDTLKTVFALTDDDRVLLVSDGSEVWAETEIISSALFLGEVHDRTRTHTEEHPVTVQKSPDSILSEQIGTPDRVIRRVKPKRLGTVGGRHIYDAGENISGVVRVTKGEGVCTLRFAEELSADGSLDFSTTGAGYTCTSGVPQIMADTFIGAGTFVPQFVWHAFRYFDAECIPVEGDIDDCEVLVIHADTPVTSAFSSSCEGLDFLYEAFLRSQLDNMHGSIPSDCPHRERLGYTGDGQNCAAAAMLLLDSREFYRKWIRDILDCQSPDNGHVQHTAPFQGGGGGPGGWGCAIVLVPFAYYEQYGEADMLADCYPAMKKWIGYLTDHSEGGLVVREEEGGWCLGDWCTYDRCAIPEPFVNTYYFVRCLHLMAEIARILGCDGDIACYQALADESRAALCDTYYADGHFCGGIQGADAYALDLELVPDGITDTWEFLETMGDDLAAKYDALGRFDTGFLCTDILLRVLFAAGHADTAYRLLSTDVRGSFLYMKRNNATTLWEDWHGGGSHNHPMFGAPVRYLFSEFLGIHRITPGWGKVLIDPILPVGLDTIAGSITTPHGALSVSLVREDGIIRAEITVPDGIDAACLCGDEKTPLVGGVNTIVF